MLKTSPTPTSTSFQCTRRTFGEPQTAFSPKTTTTPFQAIAKHPPGEPHEQLSRQHVRSPLLPLHPPKIRKHRRNLQVFARSLRPVQEHQLQKRRLRRLLQSQLQVLFSSGRRQRSNFRIPRERPQENRSGGVRSGGGQVLVSDSRQ